MAREFDGATMRLETSTTPITAYPFTLAAWCKPNNTVSGTILSLHDTSAAGDVMCIGHGLGATAGRIAILMDIGSIVTLETTAGLSNGVWGHACGIFPSATSRTVFLNGANSGTNAANLTPAAFDLVRGASRVVGVSLFNGELAEFAIWNVALSVNEILALSRGWSPLKVRRHALRFYCPLWGNDSPEEEIIGGRDFIITGSPLKTAHPRNFIWPRRPDYFSNEPQADGYLLVAN